MTKTILIIDDEPIFLEMILRDLKQRGIRVCAARNGQEAMQHLETLSPDLIVLDLLMPVMDGYEFLTELRSRDSDTPVVVLSNHDEPEDIERCRELGVADILLKESVGDALWQSLEPHLA